MEWTKGGRLDRFRYVRVSWPDFHEVGEIGSVTSCKIEENALSDLKATGTLSKVGALDLGESVEDMVRVYSVSELDGETATVCHGTFKASVPQSDRSPISVKGDASLYSVLKVLQDEVVDQAVTVSAQEDPIASAGQLCAERSLPVRAAELPGKVMAADKTFDAGTTVLSIVSGLCSLADYVLGVDAYGGVTMTPYRDPSSRAVTVTFDERSSDVLTEPDYRREMDLSSVYNLVTVVGEDADGNPVRAQARNDDATSPWSIARRGRTVSYYEEMTDKVTQAAAQARATRILRESTMVTDRETIRHLWRPFGMNDGAQVSFPSSGVVGTYGVISRTCEMRPGMPCETVVRRYVDAGVGA